MNDERHPATLTPCPRTPGAVRPAGLLREEVPSRAALDSEGGVAGGRAGAAGNAGSGTRSGRGVRDGAKEAQAWAEVGEGPADAGASAEGECAAVSAEGGGEERARTTFGRVGVDVDRGGRSAEGARSSDVPRVQYCRSAAVHWLACIPDGMPVRHCR